MSLQRRRVPEEFVIVQEKPHTHRKKTSVNRRRSDIIFERDSSRKKQNVFVENGEFLEFHTSPRKRRRSRRRHGRSDKREILFLHDADLISPRRRSSKHRDKREYVYVIEDGDDFDLRQQNRYLDEKHHKRLSLPLNRRDLILADDEMKHYRRQSHHLDRFYSYDENIAEESDGARVLSVIAQPPMKNYKSRRFVSGGDFNNNSQEFDKIEVIKEPPSLTESKQESEITTGSLNNNVSQQNQNGRMVKSSIYQKTITTNESQGNGDSKSFDIDKHRPSVGSHTFQKLPRVPDYAVVNKANHQNKQVYDRITFENKSENQFQKSPISRQVVDTTNETGQDNSTNDTQQVNKRRLVTKTTTRTTYEPDDDYQHLSNVLVQNDNNNGTSNSYIQRGREEIRIDDENIGKNTELTEWMRKQNQKDEMEKVLKSIPTESASRENDHSYGRQRADTELIAPAEVELTGVSLKYDDNIDLGDEAGDEWEDLDGDDDNKENTKGKKNRVSFLDNITKRLSPKKSSKKMKDGDDSEKNCGEKMLEKLGEKLSEFLENQASPWGRIKSCGNPETCKELKDRILGRTIFLTPTYCDNEHDKDTELNLDRMTEDTEDTYFVSRSVEFVSDERNEKLKTSDCGKCGEYMKMYCKNHERWESESD